MDIPNELLPLIKEKWLLSGSNQQFFHKLPLKITAIVGDNLNLAPNFLYNSDTIRWLIQQENVPVIDWVYKNRKYWHNLPKDVIILAIVTCKQKMVEWADSVLDPRLKEDILYTFKAITANNLVALEYLRNKGYRWSDDLLDLDNNV